MQLEKKIPVKVLAGLSLLLLIQQHIATGQDVPGEKKSTKTNVLETGAGLLQDKAPVDHISHYLDGFHFYNGDQEKQVEAHHYCSKINEEFTQCIIYDGNEKKALMIGVEYIVSERLFKSLPEEEKKLWHSHQYEVKSGQLIAPGLPSLAEHELMEDIVNTYGKTWHLWHVHEDKNLPVGSPKLMMGFTADGQIDPHLLQQRDKKFDVSSKENRKKRKDIKANAVLPGANAWEKGEIKQLPSLTERPAGK